jgi:lysophospholipase L1-like esterase
MLALGDSYTAGEGVHPTECWPQLLVCRLRCEGRSIADPVILARTGWAIGDLAAAIKSGCLGCNFDLVALLIGVNDHYRGCGTDEYELHFGHVLTMAVEFARGEPSRVVVLTIPDWGATPFASGRDRLEIAREIDALNTINKRVSRRAGTHHVDITSISREAEQDKSLLAKDNLHPSVCMYRRWVSEIAPIVRSMFP